LKIKRDKGRENDFLYPALAIIPLKFTAVFQVE